MSKLTRINHVPGYRWLGTMLFVLSLLIGMSAFLLPIAFEGTMENNQLNGMVMLVLIMLCLGALVLEAQGEVTSAKTIASLGVIVAIASVLRFIEVAIPGPGGFSPIFVPIILAGYVFGARFGFLTGVLTLLVSAVITGGIGPWLPYQMLTAGWVGLTSGWLPHLSDARYERILLVVVGAIWGFLFGLLMNFYLWPFFSGDPAISFDTTLGTAALTSRYLAFYLLTSAVWDVGRAAGNALLLFFLGVPLVRALRRYEFKMRFREVESF